MIMKPLTIGHLAASVGVNVETIRYYQRIGLLEEPERQGGFRYYGEAHEERLHFIRRGKDAGFSLDELRDLLTLDQATERKHIRALASRRLAAMEAKMADMQTLAQQLRELIRECERSPEVACCPIIRTFS